MTVEIANDIWTIRGIWASYLIDVKAWYMPTLKHGQDR